MFRFQLLRYKMLRYLQANAQTLLIGASLGSLITLACKPKLGNTSLEGQAGEFASTGNSSQSSSAIPNIFGAAKAILSPGREMVRRRRATAFTAIWQAGASVWNG